MTMGETESLSQCECAVCGAETVPGRIAALDDDLLGGVCVGCVAHLTLAELTLVNTRGVCQPDEGNHSELWNK